MTEERTPAPTRGVPVMLDRERRLRYTFKTRRELITALGGDENLAEKLTGDSLCTVLLYGLRHEDPNLTVEELEDLVDFENLSTVVEAMAKALGYKTKPKVEVLPETNPPTAAAESAAASA